MKLLVTGGAGFIGSAVVRRAVRDGHEVINLDALTYAACLDNVASVSNNPGYVFVKADIRDRAALDMVFATHAPDAVMHLAAESHVDRSIDGPGDFIETNITGTYNLLEAARTYWMAQRRPETFRFHHISTDEVFGSLGATGQFTETTPYDPRSPYSASKAAIEAIAGSLYNEVKPFGVRVSLIEPGDINTPFNAAMDWEEGEGSHYTERIRRCDVHQRGTDLQRVSKKGRGRGWRRRGPDRLGPGGHAHDLR